MRETGIRKIRLLFLFSWAVSLLFLSGNEIFAQNIPPGSEPGAQVERFRLESEQKAQELEKKKAKAPEIKVEEGESKVPAQEGLSFVLKEVRIRNSTIFKPDDFKPVYSPYLDKKITYRDLEAIVNGIKAKYKEKGYLTTTAYLPDQEIKEGVVKIDIVEGKLGNIKIEGNKWFSSDFIEKFIHAKKNELLNVNSLQRDLLRINQNPDLEIRTLISAGAEPGTSDLTLKVEEFFPWHVGMGEDNQGSFLSGRWRTSAYVRGSNAAGQGDSIYLSSQFSTDAFGESLIYNIPIGTYGTTAGLDVTYYKMRLGKQYKANEIRGTSSIYTPRISWELALQESFNARLNLGMDIEVIKKTTNGTKTTDDQLVVPYFGFNFSKNDSYGQTTFGPRFNFSVADFLGASSYNHPSASRPSTGGFFFKYEHSASRLQRMPWESYLSIRSQFQVASHTLPSSEQLQLGGAYTIRGYPEGDYLCDMGGDVNFDWVMPMYLIPKDWKLPKSDMPLRNQVEWVIFSDVGGGDIRKVASGENKHKFLAGVGGGLRLRLVKGSFLGLQWAKALGEKPVGGLGPSTFYFTFQLEK